MESGKPKYLLSERGILYNLVQDSEDKYFLEAILD